MSFIIIIVAHFRTRFWESSKLHEIVSQRKWDHEFCVTDNQYFFKGNPLKKELKRVILGEIQNLLLKVIFGANPTFERFCV